MSLQGTRLKKRELINLGKYSYGNYIINEVLIRIDADHTGHLSWQTCKDRSLVFLNTEICIFKELGKADIDRCPQKGVVASLNFFQSMDIEHIVTIRAVI